MRRVRRIGPRQHQQARAAAALRKFGRLGTCASGLFSTVDARSLIGFCAVEGSGRRSTEERRDRALIRLRAHRSPSWRMRLGLLMWWALVRAFWLRGSLGGGRPGHRGGWAEAYGLLADLSRVIAVVSPYTVLDDGCC